MTQLINNLIFLAGNILMAIYHVRLINRGQRIRHGLWAAGYLAAVGIFCLLFTWLYLPVLVLLRAVVFTPALNKFRGLGIGYTSRTTMSIIDRVEIRLFGGSWRKRLAWYTGGLVVAEVALAVFG